MVVDPCRVVGRVDPKVYGQFLSRRRGVADSGLYDPQHPDADEHGLPREVVAAILESAPTIVRWPGGCTGTSYDWREGIGPREDRARTIDAHFGYDVGNGFGTAEFAGFCRRIGAALRGDDHLDARPFYLAQHPGGGLVVGDEDVHLRE